MRRSAQIVYAVMLAALLVAGLPMAATAASKTVRLTSSGVAPQELKIVSGTTVTFRNDDDERHRVRTTSAPGDERIDADLDPGESAQVTLSVEGSYRYLDDRNDDDARFRGEIVVTAASSGGGSRGGSGGGGGGGGAQDVQIGMRDSTFRPASVTVPAGSTVTWVNDDDREHTVTATDRSFDSGTLSAGGRFTRTFRSGGTFRYLCAFHGGMTGTVTVTGAPAGGGGGTSDGAATGGTSGGATSGGSAAAAAASAGAATHQVEMRDSSFAPATVEATVGDRVVWRNTSGLPHTATARDGSFDSGMVMPGEQHAHGLQRAGTFDYVCQLHPQMTARIVVTPADGGPAPPPAPAAVGTPATSSTAGEAGSEEAGSVTIEARDFEFSPNAVAVEQGTEVIWVMAGVAPHSVTAEDGSFDSGVLQAGERYTRTFEELGTVSYACELHPGMEGTIEVVAAGTDTSDVEVAPPPGEDEASDGADADDEAPVEAVAGDRGLSLLPAAVPLVVAALVVGALAVERRRRESEEEEISV